MLKALIAAAIGCALPVLVSCSQAQFTGATPSRARVTPTNDPSTPASCAAVPATVKVGDAAVITVANPGADAELAETVTGSAKTDVALVLADGLYSVKGGGANQAVGTDAGHYTVEIRRVGTDAVIASCAFDATADGSAPAADEPPTTAPAETTVPATTVATVPPDTTMPPTTVPPTTVPPAPVCKDTEHATGAHVAFLIDNSNSNSATDCPNARQVDTFQGSGVYSCQGPTNREKAVMAAFDLLQAVADKEPSSSTAASTLAIASFPTRADFMAGWEKETNGMIAVEGANRAAVNDALAFSRKPFGQTPFGGAMSAGGELFQGLADDGKARVAVLVTDGEPTDSNPAAVAQKAAALKAQGIQVITVFYSVESNRALRRGAATQNLYKINEASKAAGRGPWYDAAYASFDSWVQALIGGNGATSLAESMSNEVVEVQNSDALKATFLSIIQKKIVCE